MRLSTIYALCDPVDGRVRYIGKTVATLGTRLSQHVTQARKGLQTHLHCWIRSLDARPVIKSLEVVPYEHDAAAEVRLIAKYRARGFDLTNATDGGEGKKGCFHTEEAKAKIRAWGVGRKMPPKSPETLQRMADAQRGKKRSLEHRMKIAAGGVGRTATAETRERLRAAKHGTRPSQETLRRSVEARVGKPLSPEHRARVVAALHSPEARAKMLATNTGRKKTPEEIAKRKATIAQRAAI